LRVFTIVFIVILLVSNILTLTSGVFNAMLSSGFAGLTGIQTLAEKRSKSVKEISSKIVKRTIKTSKRSLVSLPLEAIPYLGVATLLTMTALELKTACDNINDIDSMNDEMGYGEVEVEDELDIRVICNPDIPSLDSLINDLKN